MNPNFGTIFGIPLINTNVTTLPYAPPDGIKTKALLISDCHLGAKLKIEEAIKLFSETLNKLIANEEPNVIFVLGDLVDGTQTEIAFQQALQSLTSIPLPIYVIGGNHDRKYIPLVDWPKEKNVILSDALAIKMVVKTEGKPDTNVYLAHDLLNNYRVRDQHAFYFVDWIKQGCKATIKPEDWLITGHTHTGFISNANKISCIGQFSPEVNAFGYGTIHVDDGFVLSVNNFLYASQ